MQQSVESIFWFVEYLSKTSPMLSAQEYLTKLFLDIFLPTYGQSTILFMILIIFEFNCSVISVFASESRKKQLNRWKLLCGELAVIFSLLKSLFGVLSIALCLFRPKTRSYLYLIFTNWGLAFLIVDLIMHSLLLKYRLVLYKATLKVEKIVGVGFIVFLSGCLYSVVGSGLLRFTAIRGALFYSIAYFFFALIADILLNIYKPSIKLILKQYQQQNEAI